MTSGSPAVFVLRLAPDGTRPRTIDATHALARQGLPMVEDTAALTDDLTKAGIEAAWI